MIQTEMPSNYGKYKKSFKNCDKCGEYLSIFDFGYSSVQSDGHMKKCKLCMSLINSHDISEIEANRIKAIADKMIYAIQKRSHDPSWLTIKKKYKHLIK